MPHEWALNVVVLIVRGKGDMNCCCNIAVKLLELDVIVVERVLEKSIDKMFL